MEIYFRQRTTLLLQFSLAAFGVGKTPLQLGFVT